MQTFKTLSPRRPHWRLAITSIVLHFVTFLLLLLVGLSLPIVKSVWFIAVRSETSNKIDGDISTELRFGIWGICATSLRNPATLLISECFGPRLEWQVPPEVLELARLPSSFGSLIANALFSVLVLHLVAAAFALLAMLTSLYLVSHAASIIGLICSISASVLATLMFALDLTVLIIVRNEIASLSNSMLSTSRGSAVWMVLIAVICSWMGVVLLSVRVCYCCGVRRVGYTTA